MAAYNDTPEGFGQAFQNQFKRSFALGGEPSTAPQPEQKLGGPMAQPPLRGPRGGFQPPPPLRGPRGGWQPPPPAANFAGPGNTGIVPPSMGGKGPGGPANPWDNDMDYMRSLGWFDTPMPQIGPDGNIVPIHRREASLEDYNRWKANQGRELVPKGGPNNPKWAYFDGPNGPDGRPMDTVSTENPIGLGYAPDAQNDMAGLALRGWYRDENNNWHQRQGAPLRPPGPRPGGTTPPPPPGTGGFDPVGPGGGLGGPQGPPRDRSSFNLAQNPAFRGIQDQINQVRDNGWNWGDINNLTNRRF